MKIGCVGEAMIELNVDRRPEQIGFAGDTFNTAVYLARAWPAAEVSFVTVLGCDGMSDRMVDAIAAEGVLVDRIARHATRLPGIYAISTDARGERSFSYWRDQSAARTLFENGFDLLEGLDVIYLSAITLAILPAEVRAALIEYLGKSPAKVVFDSNYRPRLWESAEVARLTIAQAWRVTDIALPSLDDEMALFEDADEAACLARLRGYGLREGALKRGADGPVPIDPAAPPRQFARAEKVVDTTAAGDSFNGGFLGACLAGAPLSEALARGHAQAMKVIARPGAIIPQD